LRYKALDKKYVYINFFFLFLEFAKILVRLSEVRDLTKKHSSTHIWRPMAITLKSINGDRARFLLIHNFGFLENTKNRRKKKLGLQNRNKGGLGIIVKITISNITNHIGEANSQD